MKIKEEFKKLIPALTPDEFKQLETNCITEGIREAILTWSGYIIDGHNRYEIATKNNLPYQSIEKEFESEEAVKEWMILNQFGRRNLSNYQRSVLALELEDMFTVKAKENQKKGGEISQEGCQISDKAVIDTKKELAKVAGVSHDTIAKVKKIQKEAPPEIKEKLQRGEISINEAHKTIRKEEKQKELEAKKQENLLALTSEIKENKPVLYNMDCIEYLKGVKNDSVNLLFTDPPYSTDVDDISSFAQSWVDLALSKVKPNGRAFICIGAYPIEINAYLSILLKQDKFIVDNPLVWTYKNTLGITPKMKYNLNYQMVLHFVPDESPALDTSITNEMFSVMEINAPDGRLGNRFHTWQKPDELAMRLIKHTTKEGETVLDCFACTGTFLLMAAKMNRSAQGCDISKDNLLIAEKRGCNVIY